MIKAIIYAVIGIWVGYAGAGAVAGLTHGAFEIPYPGVIGFVVFGIWGLCRIDKAF